MQFYKDAAPDLEITNQLDDGLLRLLRAGDRDGAQQRLAEMIATGRDRYGAELALVTCSAVTSSMMSALRDGARIPLIKIDSPMAERAVREGRRIGVVVTFPPTTEPTSNLLREAAESAGKEIELDVRTFSDAYDALLSGNPARHDAILLDGVDRLQNDVDVVVLAQVSMARILDRVARRVPVLTSLDTSLAAIRQRLG